MSTSVHDRSTAATEARVPPLESVLPALELVHTPRLIRRIGWVITFVLIAVPLLLALAPWQQNVAGTGRVVSFDPVKRQQAIQAPIEARVKRWFVVEGQRVEPEQPIVELEDNDPTLLERLQQEVKALEDRITRARERIESLGLQIDNLRLSRQNTESAAQERLRAAEQNVEAARKSLLEQDAVLQQRKLNYERQRELRKSGVTSQLDLEVAERDYKGAEAELGRREAALRSAERSMLGAQAELSRSVADADAIIRAAEAALASAKGDLAAAERELQPTLVRRNRQQAQFITAPVAGTIHRLLATAADGGALVKAGDRLAVIVPDIIDSVVEINVSGNDMPLLRVGSPVRLQFEGWPAVQFVGWPSVAVGTFGGRIRLIDPTDDGKGNFRILVEPDPSDRTPWPSANVLRPGVRANGWILLETVPLWWEVWRQLNGFPPTVPEPKA